MPPAWGRNASVRAETFRRYGQRHAFPGRRSRHRGLSRRRRYRGARLSPRRARPRPDAARARRRPGAGRQRARERGRRGRLDGLRPSLPARRRAAPRVLPQGRHRYYRLAGPHVGDLLEALSRVAPAAPVRSLRQGTQAEALRSARTCYDHLAGRLGVAIFAALLDAGHVVGGDGRHDPARAVRDRLSARGRDIDYRLTPAGREALTGLGVEVAGDGVRYCVDWSEQRHHLSGAPGRALAARLLELRWIRRADSGRAVFITDLGRRELPRALGVSPA